MKAIQLAVLIFLLMALPFCGKNPAEPPADDNEERILFIRSTRDFSEICTMSPEGSDIRVIAHYDYDGGDRYGYMKARWSPDKTMLVVQGGPETTKDFWPLWLMDMEGKLIRQLIGNCINPIWKNNTEIIINRARVYIVDINTLEIEVLNITSDSLKIRLSDISNDNKLGLGLCWTPDNLDTFSYFCAGWKTSIASFEIDSLGIYHVLATGNNISLNIYPKWSPDETLISYCLLDESNIRNLYLMTADGDSLYRLTDETLLNPYAFIYYSWSADGHFLAYSKPNKSEEWSPYSDIFIIDIQSKLEKKITDTAQDSIRNKVMDWL